MIARYLCGCGALNAVGLMRCPQAGCGQMSPRFAAPEAPPVPAVSAPAPRRRTRTRGSP